MDGGLSPAAMMMSPSDMVGPSPVTSNGTETTEIEDDALEEAEAEAIEAKRPGSNVSNDMIDLPRDHY
jgi:hypothetical protein